MSLARRQLMLIEIEWVVRDVTRSKQTKMFLSQVNSVITKACMLCISPSQGSGWSRRLTGDHIIALNPAYTYPCINTKSGIPVSWREQVALYRLATVTYNNQGQTRLADSARTRKHCCYSFCWSQELGSANSCFIIRFTRQMIFVLDTPKLFHMLTVWRKQ